MGQRVPWRRNAPATSSAGRLMACIVDRRSVVVNQTFPQHGPSWAVAYVDALGPEVQRPVINGDRCSDLVPRLEEGRVVFQPGEEHPPLERRRQQVPSFSMTAGGACRAGPPGVPVKRT